MAKKSRALPPAAEVKGEASPAANAGDRSAAVAGTDILGQPGGTIAAGTTAAVVEPERAAAGSPAALAGGERSSQPDSPAEGAAAAPAVPPEIPPPEGVPASNPAPTDSTPATSGPEAAGSTPTASALHEEEPELVQVEILSPVEHDHVRHEVGALVRLPAAAVPALRACGAVREA